MYVCVCVRAKRYYCSWDILQLQCCTNYYQYHKIHFLSLLINFWWFLGVNMKTYLIQIWGKHCSLEIIWCSKYFVDSTKMFLMKIFITQFFLIWVSDAVQARTSKPVCNLYLHVLNRTSRNGPADLVLARPVFSR